jgi:hypothetical protein
MKLGLKLYLNYSIMEKYFYTLSMIIIYDNMTSHP